MINRAAIYTRISDDREGKGLGVERQRQECMALAERLGWTVVEVFSDNDISAYSGRSRPSYKRLLKAIEEGEIDGLIAWHTDRLHRSPKELEAFMDVVEKANLQIQTVTSGALDLNNSTGRLVARILGATARQESEHKSERGVSKQRELAMAGKFAGGSIRPYGFEKDGKTIIESEAEVIRDLVARYMAGESLSSLCRWLNVSGVCSTTHGTWRTRTIKTMLFSGRISGMREYKQEIVAVAEWDPIISRELGEQIRARMKIHHPYTVRTARRYLLSGMLRCGMCGTLMISQSSHGIRTYRCLKGVANIGCGLVSIKSELVEEAMCEAVLIRLESKEFQNALRSRAGNNEQVRAAESDLLISQSKLEELAIMYAQGEMTRSQQLTAHSVVMEKVKSAQRILASATQSTFLLPEKGESADLASRFKTLNLDRQRAIIKTALDNVVIAAGSNRGFHLARVQPIWRL